MSPRRSRCTTSCWLAAASTCGSVPYRRSHYRLVVPALVRYLTKHRALSYWFAGPQRGARPDEGAREQRDELDVALGWIERAADRGEPVDLMAALAPLLVDSSELKLRSG